MVIAALSTTAREMRYLIGPDWTRNTDNIRGREKRRDGFPYKSSSPRILAVILRKIHAPLPQAQPATRERLEIFYFDDAVRDAAFDVTRAANKRLWQTIFAEDRAAVEGMQRGRLSPGFDGGIFSPVMDPPTHVFHCRIARAMLDGRGPTPVFRFRGNAGSR